jgi:hypothetical protein
MQVQEAGTSDAKRAEVRERRFARTSRNLSSALSAARKALSNLKCQELLTGGNGSIDPLALLNDIAEGRRGSFVVTDISDASGYVTSATAQVAEFRPVDIGNNATQLQAATVLIRINALAGNFANGSLADQRTTILHELGHAIYHLYGPLGSQALGASYSIQPDVINGDPNKTAELSQANQARIMEACR